MDLAQETEPVRVGQAHVEEHEIPVVLEGLARLGGAAHTLGGVALAHEALDERPIEDELVLDDQNSLRHGPLLDRWESKPELRKSSHSRASFRPTS